ncbi:MAG: aspartate kinase [Prevotellaceae bacterium]|jgi:aspartate kinase|nr:aspartate kinase [Prevotellaceae bacterium]
MLVYKFGGASINSPEGVCNLGKIISKCDDKLIVVVSAAGKTTNMLEAVNAAYFERNTDESVRILSEIEDYHCKMIEGLPEMSNPVKEKLKYSVKSLVDSVKDFIGDNKNHDFDYCYGQIVSLGELLSSTVVNEYVNSTVKTSELVDARNFITTDSLFREARVYFDKTEKKLENIFSFHNNINCYITQGFIGSNLNGDTTALGREGSDYSAAIIASLTGANSLTIWKDVPGVLSADPKLFPDAKLLPELSYKDAAELSYYGAQVMHQKTIKPLVNKNIPLYVKSFADTGLSGTDISSKKRLQDIPVIATKKNQILISILPKDFSFALEDALIENLLILQRYRLKIHLIQSTPLCISLCVDDGRNTRLAIDELRIDGLVQYNDSLELITIRNYTENLIEQYSGNREKLIMQRDRSTVRILLKNNELF